MGQSESIFGFIDDEAKQRAIAAPPASVAGGLIDHPIVVEWLEKLADDENVTTPLSIRSRD